MRFASLGTDLLWVGFGRMIGALGLLLVTATLSRRLTPTEYGEFFLLVSLVSVAVLVSASGQPQIVVRELGRQSGALHGQILLHAMVIAGSAAAVISLLIGAYGGRLAALIDITALETLGWLVGLWVFAATLLRVAGEGLRGVRKLALASFVNGQAVTGSAATLILLIALLAPSVLRQDLDLAATMRAIVIATGLSLVWALVVLARYRTEAPLPPSPLPLHRYLTSGLPILGGSLVAFASSQGDLWIVHAALETDRVAVYGAVRMLATLGVVPLVLVSAALLPRIAAAHYSGRRVELERLSRASASVALLLSAILLTPAILAPQSLLSLIFGPYYADGGTALRLLATASLINVCSGPWGAVLVQTGHQKLFLVINSLGAIVGLGLAGWLVRPWGVEGVAGAILLGQTVLAVAGTAALRHRLGITALPSFAAAEVIQTLRLRS